MLGVAFTAVLLLHSAVLHSGHVCAASESAHRRVDVLPLLVDGADAELVTAQETLTLQGASNLGRHLYRMVDPLWGALAGPEGSTMEWEACGGAFRQEWRLAAVAGSTTSPHGRRAFERARSHVRCGTAWASLCTPQRGRGWNESTYARYAARTMSLLSTLSSIPLQWERDTPQHQRPTGIASFTSGYMRCGLFLATESTLCTQQLVPMLRPSGSSSPFLTDLVPSSPFLLRTGWHHLHVTVAHSNDGALTVSHQLSFVVTRSDRDEWLRFAESNAALRLLVAREPRSSAEHRSVLSSSWTTSMWLASDSDALGTMFIELCWPSTYPPRLRQQSPRLLLLFPTSVVRPLLHSLAPHVIVRHARFDDRMSTLVVLLDALLPPDSVGTCAVVAVPFVAAYAPLAERPPDANKRYVIPQPVLRVSELSEDQHHTDGTSPDDVQEEYVAWRSAFSVPGERHANRGSVGYVYHRIAASEAPRVSLPVPDAAMVFNAISIGLLPFSVLLGTVLRRTGRQQSA